MQIKKIITIIFLLTTISHISLALTPSCDSIQPQPIIPLMLGETFSLQLEDVFIGNNLDFSLSTNSSTTKLNKRIDQLDSKVFFLPNIIHQYVEEKESQLGKQTSILFRNGTKTYLTFGIYTSTSILDKSSTVLIEDDKDLVCFSSVLFPEHNISIVDCIKQKSDYVDNYFYYIDTQKLNVLKTVRNMMYYFFQNITKRDMVKLINSTDGREYLVRSYYSDGVEPSMSDYAYAEIFNAKNPQNLTALKIIDRTFLGLPSANIRKINSQDGYLYLLDLSAGLFRINIEKQSYISSENIMLKNGFTNFAKTATTTVLANDLAAYEIDHEITNKYSLLGLGKVKSVIVNDYFFVVQTTNSNSSSIQVFKKGAKTYSSAFIVLTNLSIDAVIYLNRKSDILRIVSESKMTLYQLSLPKVIHQFLSGREGTIENVTIVAQSKLPNSTTVEKCEVKYQLKIVSDNDQVILKSTYPAISKYIKNQQSKDNPGLLKISLNKYYYGANLSYALTNESKQKLNASSCYIEQINKKTLQFQNYVKGDIIFMKTDHDSSYGKRSHNLIQTSDYLLKQIDCFNLDQKDQICRNNCQRQLTSRISVFTYIGQTKIEYGHKGYAFVQSLKPNLIDYASTDTNTQWQGTIKYDVDKVVIGLYSFQDELYVLKKSDSVIDVFNNEHCYSKKNCHFDYQVNITNLLKPQQYALDILSNRNYQFVLFLRLPKSILVIDARKQTVNRLIAEIQTKQTNSSSFYFLISSNKLIITSSLNTVTVFSLDLLTRRGQAIEEKKLPLYGNNLYSLDNVISSNRQNGLLYVHSINPKDNSTSILIYKLNTPPSVSLYASIELPTEFSKSGTQMSVFFQQKDVLIVVNSNKTFTYEIFDEPQAVFTEDINQKFKLTFSNSYSNISYETQTCEIEITSADINFKKTKDLDTFVKEVKLDKPGTYSWDDSKWFEGNVVGYSYSCEQCDGTPSSMVSFRSHYGTERQLGFKRPAFYETSLGSLILDNCTLVKLNRDFTVRQKIKIFQSRDYYEKQMKMVSSSSQDIIVFIATRGFTTSTFHITTKTGNESKTSQTLYANVSTCQKAQIVGDILMILDYSLKDDEILGASVSFYDLKMERVRKAYNSYIDALSVINENDLKNVFGYNRDKVLIRGSHLMKLQGNTYRLYILEARGGLFIMDFSYKVGQEVIDVIRISYEDLNVVIEQNNLYLPNDAIAQSLSFVSASSVGQTTFHSLLVGCSNYDNFIFSIGFDKNNKVVQKQLKSVLYRYGNYQVKKSEVNGDFVGISYYSKNEKYQNNFVIYDISKDSSVGYEKKNMLAQISISLQFSYAVNFGFHTTQSLATNGKSIGLISWISTKFSWDQNTPQIQERVIYKDLELQLKPGYKAGTFTLIPWKINQTEQINLSMTASTSFPNNFMKGNLKKQTLIEQ